MRLTADGAGGEPVFVDLFKGNQMLLSETLAMNAGHGTSVFDLPPDLFGTVRLCAYRLGAERMMMSKTRVVYIHPAKQLKIAPKLDKEEYRPGQRAHLDLTVTDAKGQPCPGALSLAGVDEAVFSVLAQRPGREETFYTVEEPLLKPVYALYPWSPRRPAADGERLEQALFAATTRTRNQQEVERNRRGSDADISAPSSTHTLSAASWPDKVLEITPPRLAVEHRFEAAWVGLLLVSLGLGYVAAVVLPASVDAPRLA